MNQCGHILLFGARRRIRFAEALRPLAHAHQVRVLGCDTDALDPLRFHVDEFFLLPDVGAPRFIDELAEAGRRYKIGSLLPWNDRDIRWLSAHSEALEDLGLRLLLPPPGIVELFCDKHQTAEWASRSGLKHAAPVSILAPSFPCFVKPRFGQGGVHAHRVDNPAQLAALPLPLNGESWVCQELLEGNEYTVDVGLKGSCPLFIAPRRRIKTRGGEVLIARLELEPSVIAFVEELCGQLEFHGIFNVQVFLHGDEVTLIECNPRFGGGTDLTIEAGANVPLYLLEQHLYGEIRSPSPRLRSGLTMTRYFAADFFEADQVDPPGP